MLTASQIQELVKGGEGYNVDFKRSVPSKVKEISDEVAGFANVAGGYVLIGVDNDNQIIGAEIDNNKRSAIQDTIGEISPALKCEFYPVDVECKKVWVIDVPSGKDKPYITGGIIYVREGANCQKLRSAEEIAHSLPSVPRFSMMPYHANGLTLTKILIHATSKSLWKKRIYPIRFLLNNSLIVLNSTLIPDCRKTPQLYSLGKSQSENSLMP